MIGWTMLKRNNGPEQSFVCHSTPASNTHHKSRGKRNQYRLMLWCPGSIGYIRAWRWNKERRETEGERAWVQRKKRGRRRERGGAFWSPALLPIVNRQLCCIPLLQSADVSSPCDLPLLDLLVLPSIVEHLQKQLPLPMQPSHCFQPHSLGVIKHHGNAQRYRGQIKAWFKGKIWCIIFFSWSQWSRK